MAALQRRSLVCSPVISFCALVHSLVFIALQQFRWVVSTFELVLFVVFLLTPIPQSTRVLGLMILQALSAELPPSVQLRQVSSYADFNLLWKSLLPLDRLYLQLRRLKRDVAVWVIVGAEDHSIEHVRALYRIATHQGRGWDESGQPP